MGRDIDFADDETDDVVKFYVNSKHVESPSVRIPRCPNCGAELKDSLTEMDQNEGDYRMKTLDGYCHSCGSYVTFDHQFAIESKESIPVLDRMAEFDW